MLTAASFLDCVLSEYPTLVSSTTPTAPPDVLFVDAASYFIDPPTPPPEKYSAWAPWITQNILLPHTRLGNAVVVLGLSPDAMPYPLVPTVFTGIAYNGDELELMDILRPSSSKDTYVIASEFMVDMWWGDWSRLLATRPLRTILLNAWMKAWHDAVHHPSLNVNVETWKPRDTCALGTKLAASGVTGPLVYIDGASADTFDGNELTKSVNTMEAYLIVTPHRFRRKHDYMAPMTPELYRDERIPPTSVFVTQYGPDGAGAVDQLVEGRKLMTTGGEPMIKMVNYLHPDMGTTYWIDVSTTTGTAAAARTVWMLWFHLAVYYSGAAWVPDLWVKYGDTAARWVHVTGLFRAVPPAVAQHMILGMLLYTNSVSSLCPPPPAESGSGAENGRFYHPMSILRYFSEWSPPSFSVQHHNIIRTTTENAQVTWSDVCDIPPRSTGHLTRLAAEPFSMTLSSSVGIAGVKTSGIKTRGLKAALLRRLVAHVTDRMGQTPPAVARTSFQSLAHTVGQYNDHAVLRGEHHRRITLSMPSHDDAVLHHVYRTQWLIMYWLEEPFRVRRLEQTNQEELVMGCMRWIQAERRGWYVNVVGPLSYNPLDVAQEAMSPPSRGSWANADEIPRMTLEPISATPVF